jgi:Tol biopolymer transport system component
MRIFISYAREDQAAVEALNADLKRARFQVWLDEDLIGNEAWWDTILEQIRLSDLYIVALSPNSLRSRACKAELDYAIALNRPLLPLLIREVAIQLAHPAIAGMHIVDYRKRSMESLLALMAFVANRPPAPPLPNPLPAAPTTPMSCMNEIRELVGAPDLTYQKQAHLLSDLKGYLDRDEEREIALQLLRGLRQRRDISYSIAQEIDRLPEFAHDADPKAAPGPMAGQPSVGPKPAAIVDENVQFTVYRPNAIQPEVWYPLIAFAHLAERRPDAPPGQADPLDQVRRLAAQALGDHAGYGAPRVDARGAVPREGQLTFVPFVEGLDFNPRSLTFEWEEDVHQQNFRLKARGATAGRVLRGQFTVYLGAFILADVDLMFRVDIAAPAPPSPTGHTVSLEPELTPETAVPYQKVFPSYSHKDLAIVRQAEAYGKALGHVYLRDRLALRSGEQWEQRLLELIDEADIFQLFWSSNSMTSEYVRREWEHALALGRRAFIRPTYWEVPMPHSANPVLPPDELAKLHFHGFFEESHGPTVEAPDVALPREAVAGELGRQEPPSLAPPESRSPPTAPAQTFGLRRRAALILTAAAVVAGVSVVPGLILRPTPGAAPTPSTPSVSSAPTSRPSSPTSTKPSVVALPRSVPLPDTQLLVPVVVDGAFDIYLGDVTKNAPVRALIKRPGDQANVTLSPDRTSMIYLHEGVLQVAAVDGTGSRPLFSRVPKQCVKSTTRPGWNSADPTQIAIGCEDAGGKAGVYLVTIDGKVIRKLSEDTDVRVGDPGFSPDGKFVVFWANNGLVGERKFDGGDIVVALTDGKGKPRRVTRMTDTVYDADPAWSPNGDQIAFRRRDRTGDRKNSDVWVINADGKSEGKPLAEDPDADEQSPSWSPSGDEIAYQSNAKTAAWPGPARDRVWVMNSNGTNQGVLWTSGGAALGRQVGPSWSSH